MTPDITAFARKHLYNAKLNGYRHGLREAVQEAGTWTYSRAHEYLFDNGRLIWEDEWEICLVLDATRIDQWRHITPEYDWLNPEHAWSVGAASPEWYGHTFTPQNLPEDERIGIVTANPFASKPADRLPHLLHDATPVHEHIAYTDYVHEDAWGCTVDGHYLDVAHPGEVTNRAYQAWHEQDLDRLVVHYMQPHLPFRSRPEWFGARDDLDAFGEPDRDPRGPYDSGRDFWWDVRDGNKSVDDVWDAYCDNLEWALECIEPLHDALDAEFLITSDHGNALGEWGLWSHPPQMHTPQLRRVPWTHTHGNGKHDFTPLDVESSATDEGRDIDDQLRALGYRQEETHA